MTDNEPEAQSPVGCKYCPTRKLCQCPAGPEKCALRDCPCDELCPCPPKLERPDDNCCPWPAARGRRGAFGGLLTLVGAVVLTALGWNGAPFAAMALLLILIPIALGIVLVMGSMGRFGRRAAVPFLFPGWATIVFALFGLGLIAAGIAALLGDASPAALPLLIIAAMLPRADPRDVLVTGPGGSDAGAGIAGLPEGAVVGTASLRRRAQILAARPDLHVITFRGTAPTRPRKRTGKTAPPRKRMPLSVKPCLASSTTCTANCATCKARHR